MEKDTSWIETHFHVVSAISIEMNQDKFTSKVIEDRYDAQGTGGMYELAEELTDEFEKKNEGREWDGDYFDEIDAFLHKRLFMEEITKEEAKRLFPNYVIFFEDEKGDVQQRCWWNKIDGHFHQFPEAKKYYSHKITQK